MTHSNYPLLARRHLLFMYPFVTIFSAVPSATVRRSRLPDTSFRLVPPIARAGALRSLTIAPAPRFPRSSQAQYHPRMCDSRTHPRTSLTTRMRSPRRRSLPLRAVIRPQTSN
ncbi:hypothetical protein B0H19DRAFT_1253954 [Mycena capillaripes]|nr:hypothetical protein B0H19DRAFT_1253954 [Mycena capillaripes]